jgi:AraC-like DNA-binding protein
MLYREIKPGPPLHRFVECFWTLQGDAAFGTSAERILPDGCVELILNFGAQFIEQCDGKKKRQPRNFLVGQMTGPILISPTGPVELLGIRFHPSGTLPFLRVPLDEVTDRVVELGSLSSKLERDLMRVTSQSSLLSEKITAVGSFLVSCLASTRHDSRLLTLAARIVESGGLVSVDRIANDAGLSSRQLERRFLREVGVGPKLLGRIIRFQQVFRAVEQCNAAWADIAVACGYYDQAHLIRDFNQFAQQTPAVLFASQSPLTESFTRKARASDFSNTAG